MIKKKEIDQKDLKTWEEYIKNPTDIYDKEKKNIPEKLEKKNRYKFDLHGFTLEEANIKVQEIIKHCIKNKFKELLLITGKGIHSSNNTDVYVSRDLGRLKHSVPEFIKKNSELNKFIVSINDAEKRDGGSGAIIIKLRNL